MELFITPGDKSGYFYFIEEEGKTIAAGYYKLEKHAKWWGELALSTYKRVRASA